MPKFKVVRHEKKYSDICNGIVALINNYLNK